MTAYDMAFAAYLAIINPARRAPLVRFFPGRRGASWKPRALRIGRFVLPLPFLGRA